MRAFQTEEEWKRSLLDEARTVLTLAMQRVEAIGTKAKELGLDELTKALRAELERVGSDGRLLGVQT